MQSHDKAEIDPEGTNWSNTLKYLKAKYNSMKPFYIW